MLQVDVQLLLVKQSIVLPLVVKLPAFCVIESERSWNS